MPAFATEPADLTEEIKSLHVTFDPIPSEADLSVSPVDRDLISDLYHELTGGKPATIKTLKRLVDKYPAVPSLKNHLTAAYVAAGLYQKADNITDLLLKENPDYLFAHINLANRYLEPGEEHHIPEILGETLRLRDFKPTTDLFHSSEVKAFYLVVAHFHVLQDRTHSALAIHGALYDLVGTDSQLQQLQLTIGQRNMQRMSDVFAQDKARAITVTPPDIPPRPPSADPPQLHHPEIAELYSHGFDLPPATIDTILALPRATAIADLEALLHDAVTRAPLFLSEELGDDSKQLTFPLHAIYFLGEMEAADSLPAVIASFSQHPDILDMWFGDSFFEGMGEPLYRLFRNQPGATRSFVLSPGIPETPRAAVAVAFANTAIHEPDRRPEVISWLSAILEFLLTSPPSDNILDTSLVTSLIGPLLDLNATETLPLITAHYEKHHIAIAHFGDLDSIKTHLQEKTHRRPQLLGLKKRYRSYTIPYRGSAPSLTKPLPEPPAPFGLSLPSPTPKPTVGRNAPCPCGSGKKYKKCCL